MCLDISKDSKRVKAETDIICFKYVRKIINYTSPYVTPYRKHEINIGSTYTSRLIKNRNIIHIGIHSLCTAKELYTICSHDKNYIPVRCIIPKGTWYYRGLFGVYNSYASQKLQYIEIMDMKKLKELYKDFEYMPQL